MFLCSRAALMLLSTAMMVPTACSAQNAAIPNDGRDDAPALQAAIDRLAQTGGGTLTLAAGTYDLKQPLYLRTGVTLAGKGPATILDNGKGAHGPGWFGTTVFAGNLTPASFEDYGGRGYAGHPAERRSATSITISRCDPAVAPRASQVVWVSSAETRSQPRLAPGVRGEPPLSPPVYGEMNRVASVSGCDIGLVDPITIPAGMPILVHWSDGSKAFLIRSPIPNAPIADAGLRDMTLISARGAALKVTGCYHCTFENLTIGKSRPLLTLQGIRHTKYSNIKGYFTQRGIEVAKYATESTVDGVDATYLYADDPVITKIRPAIRFGEFSRDNTLRNIRLVLGNGYNRVDKIRYDASSNNSLINVELWMARDDGFRRTIYRSADGLIVPNGVAPESGLKNVRICFIDTHQCKSL